MRSCLHSELVHLELNEMDAPGSPRSRVICAVCDEGVNDGREVMRRGWKRRLSWLCSVKRTIKN